MTDVEKEIRELFEQNCELLQSEGGHSLTQDVKNAALQQVLLYWRKMREVAEKVTETEVRLSLPEQLTPQGRKYGIEGVVDIIREDDRTVMYDIKTHDADYVEANKELYEKQLNVYAHIWQNLQSQSLEQTAVIATAYPDSVREALIKGDEEQLEVELQNWNPLIDIPFNQQNVQQTIEEFGTVVDAIESNKFAPPPVEKLKTRIFSGGKQRRFAAHVCRNCDARFSCLAYREYVQSSQGRPEPNFAQYFQDFGTDLEQDNWLDINLSVAPEDFAD